MPVLSEELPSTVEPGQIQRQLQSDPIAPKSKPSSPMISIPEPAEITAAGPSFVLKGLRFEGSTIFSDAELFDLADLEIGATVDLKALTAAANKITRAYRSQGYVISQAIVPAQNADNGQIILSVIEGFSDQVTFTGQVPSSDDRLSNLASVVSELRPLDVAKMERQMLLMNDLPGISASATLAPSPSGQKGAAQMIVNIARDRGTATVELNNRSTEQLGPHRLSIDASSYLADKRHSELTAFVLLEPQDNELQFFSFGANTSVGNYDGRLNFSVNDSQSEPDLGSSLLKTESHSNTLNISYSQPVTRTRLRNTYIDVGLNHFKSDSDSLEREQEERRSTLSFAVNHDQVGSNYTVNQLTARATFGFAASTDIDLLGASSGAALPPEADENFSRLNIGLSQLRRISDKVSFLAAIDGQLSDDFLPAGERYGIGGGGFVRAYDASEQTGESGYAAKFELRYAGRGERVIYTPFVYYDFGEVTRHRLTATDIARKSDLQAAGIGLRFTRGALAGYAELAFPLADDVGSEGDDDARAFFGLSYNMRY